ncbi:hypothetical protein ACIOMM_20030 [Streptomyces sp. NPDC087908]|uniref:hypothetical protein n=1 Tax=Streptomyces sp. NPDC087908 TaxID=3365820 RepID=UPI00381A70EB
MVTKTRERRGKVIVFTDPWPSPAAAHADAVLTTQVTSYSPYDSLALPWLIQLVLIDEIHRPNLRTTTDAPTVDLIKDLTERLPAMFVCAGINVTDTPLFTGTRSAEPAPSPGTSPTSTSAPPAAADPSPD